MILPVEVAATTSSVKFTSTVTRQLLGWVRVAVHFGQSEICDHDLGSGRVWSVEKKVFRLDVQVENIVGV